MPDEPTIDLRCKVGPYRGQVLPYKKSVAEHLLASGQAEYPDGKTPAARRETATAPPSETRSIAFPKHTGGGWYELSDGSKVQGKANAQKAQKKLAG